MVELLKQDQYIPFGTIDQCIAIFAGSRGFLDDLELTKVHAFESDLLEHFRGPGKALRDKLVEARSFKELGAEFGEAIKTFKAGWTAVTS
jgi:F-type H+-transporting ATPase subunit alpha